MDDIVYRPRYQRQLPSQSKKKVRRNKKDKDSFVQKFLTKTIRQTLICLIVFLVIMSIVKITTPQTVFLQNKLKDALSHNIDLKSSYSDLQYVLNSFVDEKKESREADFSKDDNDDFEVNLKDTDTLPGVENQHGNIDGLEPVSAIYTEEQSLVESMEYEKDDSEQVEVETENDIETEEFGSEMLFGNAGYSFLIPVGGIIGSFYGERLHPIKNTILFHKGIDIEAQSGTPIKAAYDGEIVEADMEASYGNYVKVKHVDGLTTLYAHCSKLLVSKGQKVKKGDVIAEVGCTGVADGPHLHFEVRKDNSAVNPLDYIALSDNE